MYSDLSYLSSIKSYSPSKWVHFACFCLFLTIFSLLWKDVSFDESKILKICICIQIWNQQGSQFQKNIIWNILIKKKNLHFFIHSYYLKKFYSLYSSSQNYLSNEVLLLIKSFYLEEQLIKMYGLPFFLTYSLKC